MGCSEWLLEHGYSVLGTTTREGDGSAIAHILRWIARNGTYVLILVGRWFVQM